MARSARPETPLSSLVRLLWIGALGGVFGSAASSAPVRHAPAALPAHGARS